MKSSITFYDQVYRIVRRIPPGKVASYGQIARLAGRPGAARAVGNALHKNPDGVRTPCFRVVNSKGGLSGAYAFGGLREQCYLLEQDGVEVVNFRVDMERFQWKDEEIVYEDHFDLYTE